VEQRPFRERYYAIIGSFALAFAVLRALGNDYTVAAVLAVVGIVMLGAAAFDRSGQG
jgi:hypothetical protein